jgi:hypothetical protein
MELRVPEGAFGVDRGEALSQRLPFLLGGIQGCPQGLESAGSGFVSFHV